MENFQSRVGFGLALISLATGIAVILSTLSLERPQKTESVVGKDCDDAELTLSVDGAKSFFDGSTEHTVTINAYRSIDLPDRDGTLYLRLDGKWTNAGETWTYDKTFITAYEFSWEDFKLEAGATYNSSSWGGSTYDVYLGISYEREFELGIWDIKGSFNSYFRGVESFDSTGGLDAEWGATLKLY